MGFGFHKWPVYIDARKLNNDIFIITKTWPKGELYLLTDQIKRASLSVVLQIAEGYNRKTDKDKRLFFNRSHTSIDEIVACLDIAFDQEYITSDEYTTLYTKCGRIARQLQGLNRYLNQ